MKEREFLERLESRAQEQQQLMKGVPLPGLFSFIALWFGVHPWRIIVPFAFLLSLLLHVSFGYHYDSFILKIFGGFNILHL